MGLQSIIIATYQDATCVKIMVTLKQTLLRTREWSVNRLETVSSIGDKHAIYKEFEEWIEMDDPDHNIFSLEFIGEGSEYDI